MNQTQHEDMKEEFEDVKQKHSDVVVQHERMKFEHEENLTRLQREMEEEVRNLRGKKTCLIKIHVGFTLYDFMSFFLDSYVSRTHNLDI